MTFLLTYSVPSCDFSVRFDLLGWNKSLPGEAALAVAGLILPASEVSARARALIPGQLLVPVPGPA